LADYTQERVRHRLAGAGFPSEEVLAAMILGPIRPHAALLATGSKTQPILAK
jgi:hypothetical protein